MQVDEFNKDFMQPLLDKLCNENKQVFLIGDFNIDLLQYNNHEPINNFLDTLTSNMFLPQIILPTRITSHSKTLIDNIFTNEILPDCFSGNITSTISDHLPQFLIIPNFFSHSNSYKAPVYSRNWKNFNSEDFILDYFGTDWQNILKIHQNDVNISFDNLSRGISFPPYSNKVRKITKTPLTLDQDGKVLKTQFH